MTRFTKTLALHTILACERCGSAHNCPGYTLRNKDDIVTEDGGSYADEFSICETCFVEMRNTPGEFAELTAIGYELRTFPVA